MTETTIYVGLNDSVTREQIFGTEKYVSVMKKVCCAYHVPFSLRLEQGAGRVFSRKRGIHPGKHAGDFHYRCSG